MIKKSDIQKVEISLLPDGRAWDIYTGGSEDGAEASLFTDGEGNVFTDGEGNYFTDGSTRVSDIGQACVDVNREIIAEFMNDIVGMMDQLVPDNDNFDLNDIENFEREFGLTTYENQTQEERKNAILAKLYVSDQEYKGVTEYLQEILRSAGFDVYVHQNRFPYTPQTTKYGTRSYGNARYGLYDSGGAKFTTKRPSFTYTSYVANYIDYAEEVQRTGTLEEIESNSISLGSFFFVSGATYDTPADIPSERVAELRTIILKNKPAHLVAVINTNEV